MKLLIFQACQAEQADDKEDELRTSWESQEPVVGDLVSMGGNKLWSIQHVYAYKPANLISEVEAVYLVQVNREDFQPPSQEDWDCLSGLDLHPNEVLNFYFLNVGEKEVYCEFNCQGELPPVDQPITQYYLDSANGKPVPKVRTAPWTVEQVGTFLPASNAPYPAIYLAFCTEKVSVAA